MISNPLITIKKYLVIGGAFVIAIFLAILKGMSLQKTKTKVAQKEIELEAHKAVAKAKEEGRKVTDENNDKADDGDWSGINR